MLINCTESPYQEWTKDMLDKLRENFGLIVNQTLPGVNKNMIDEDIDLIAEENFEKIMTLFDEKSDRQKPDAVFMTYNLPMHKRVQSYLDESSIDYYDLKELKEEGIL